MCSYLLPFGIHRMASSPLDALPSTSTFEGCTIEDAADIFLMRFIGCSRIATACVSSRSKCTSSIYQAPNDQYLRFTHIMQRARNNITESLTGFPPCSRANANADWSRLEQKFIFTIKVSVERRQTSITLRTPRPLFLVTALKRLMVDRPNSVPRSDVVLAISPCLPPDRLKHLLKAETHNTYA